jgi:hypothetical protein
MRKILKLRPSPPMAVAIAALVVAIAGTAMAAPTAINSVLNKNEKKQTKAIAKNQANQQIDNRAPGLSVGTAGLANSVAGNAISSAQVLDNGLNAVDLSTVTGASDENFTSIATNDCQTRTINTGVNVDNDVIAVSVDDTIEFANGGLTVHASDSNAANLIRVNVCNVTGSAIDPPSANFRYIVFRR